MPIYDYKCTNCDRVFEVVHSMSQDPEVLCPECNSKAERTISKSIGISFKGPGFYINDSREGNK